ncbi:GntR family transcriptional regulator [Kribbella sp. NPDC049584]|uniref:GntR family transcriptional regulator n=1 Tax=Kribbella sp. NPDC049584 TaxID=3154833 RepID=UPI00344928C7
MKLDKTSTSAPYLQVAQAIRDSIVSGELRPGDRLPTGPKLAKELGVATMTVRRAIELLRREGLLRSTQGVGVFVATSDINVSEPPDLEQQVRELRERVIRLEQLAAGKGSSSEPE